MNESENRIKCNFVKQCRSVFNNDADDAIGRQRQRREPGPNSKLEMKIFGYSWKLGVVGLSLNADLFSSSCSLNSFTQRHFA